MSCHVMSSSDLTDLTETGPAFVTRRAIKVEVEAAGPCVGLSDFLEEMESFTVAYEASLELNNELTIEMY